MSLIYHAHKHGLILAEQAGDEAVLSRALKRMDPDLILVKERDERYQTWVWKVLCLVGDDRPAVHILDWREDGIGRPLPLTGRILDAVNEQRSDRPGGYDSMKESDAHNERLRQRRRAEFEGGVDAISEEFSPSLERGRIAVSPGGAKPLPSWLRNKHLPDGVRKGLR